jgi:hypothetical protein
MHRKIVRNVSAEGHGVNEGSGTIYQRIRDLEDPPVKAFNDIEGCNVKCFGLQQRHFRFSLTGLKIKTNEQVAIGTRFPIESPMTNPISYSTE